MRGDDLTRRQLLLAAAAGAGLALGRVAPAAAAERATPLIPRRLLFADPDRSTVRLSPDGSRLAFLAPANGALNVWVTPIRDVSRARPLTWVTDRNLAPWLFWMPNNRHVIFFREEGGDENWQAHRVDVDTGEVLALTPGPGVRSHVQEISYRFPDELLLGHNQRDPRYFEIFRVNTVTGAATLLQANDRFAFHFTDSHFHIRFAVRRADDGGLQYLQRSAAGEWEPFVRVDMADELTTRLIELSDDGALLYWLDSRRRDRAAVVAQDMATGATRVLAEDPEADLGEVTLDPRTQRPLAAAVARRSHDRLGLARYAELARLLRARRPVRAVLPL